MVACLAALVKLGVTAAIAGTPFGGDDTGFVPPDEQTLRCENRVDRLFGNQTKGLARCATRQLVRLFSGKVTDAVEAETCKTAAHAETEAALDGLVDKHICTHECSDKANFALGVSLIDQTIEIFTGLLACEGTKPWPGGDDGGAKIPSTRKILRCELRVGEAALELSAAEDHCQRKLADSRFKNRPFDEDACHAAAEARYDRAVAKLRNCPRCLNRSGLKVPIRAFVDGDNQGIYCASPSGAFTD
jgi:hypothetical protein